MKKYTFVKLLAMELFNNLLVAREENYHPQDISLRDYMKTQIYELQDSLNSLLKLSKNNRLNFDEKEVEAMANVFLTDKNIFANKEFKFDFNNL